MLLSENEIVIGDLNYREFVGDQVVEGERKARGLIPRNYNAHPIGSYRGVVSYADVNIPIIPRSEWSERIRDRVAQKAQLSDLRLRQGWKSLDQNGQGFCHTADTEVLTEKGWVAWPEYNWSDLLATMNQLTGELEFQAPLARHVYDYDGEMVYSTNRRVDFGVTPDHRMYVRKWDEGKRTLSNAYSFVTAANLGWYVGLPHSTTGFVGTELKRLAIEGDREYDGDDLLALLGLVVSDGYAGGTDNTRNWVSFASFREDTRANIAALAARLGFRECPSRRGVWVRYDAGALAHWVRANCYTGAGLGAANKRVPDLIKCASMRQIGHFLHHFDDRNRDASQFYSSSKRLIDDLQELHLRIGKRSAVGARTAPKDVPFAGNANGVIRSSGGYVLTVSDGDSLCLDRKKHIEKDHYRGQVYCATVPNSTLVTRRNGTVLISGNCWAYSSTACVHYLRAVMNQPHVRLSAHAVACMIKGFRDQGGWGAHSLEFIMDRGVPSVEFWAEKSMSRSNDKPETWENAKLYRVLEGWVDLSAAVYSRTLTFDQFCSLNLCGVPTIDDYNWWGHSVCGIDVVDGQSQWSKTRDKVSGKLLDLAAFDLFWGMNNPVTTGYARRIQNSWSDSWSEQGMGVLTGSKCIPDGGAAPRRALAA